MKYATSVPAIYTIDKECVYESHMFGAAPLSSKAENLAEANAETSQQTVTRKESEDLQTWEFKGWVVGHLYYRRAVCEISRVRALPHAAAR